jgi:hypothetical protein
VAYAGVAQLVELQPSKLDVAGSNPVSRSAAIPLRNSRPGFARPPENAPPEKNERMKQQAIRTRPNLAAATCNSAHVAQLVEHVLGKDEVTRSIRVVGSRPRKRIFAKTELKPSELTFHTTDNALFGRI